MVLLFLAYDQKEIDKIDPENVGKRDFYLGMMQVCLGIRDYGKNLKAAAYAQAEKRDRSETPGRIKGSR